MDRLSPAEAVARMLDRTDASDVTWRRKFDDFVEFLTERCSPDERKLFTEAAERTQTRGIRVDDDEREESELEEGAWLIRPDAEGGLPLPEAVANELSFHFAVEVRDP